MIALTTSRIDPTTHAAWQLDSVHTEMGFAVKHVMISRLLKGWFRGASGSAAFDESGAGLATLAVQIPVASIDTGLESRDQFLRSPEFLDAGNHPLITFKGRRLEGDPGVRFTLVGDLSIRGITREQRLAVSVTGLLADRFGGERVGYRATGSFDRREFGLENHRALEASGFVVDPEVSVTIDAQLVRRPGPPVPTRSSPARWAAVVGTISLSALGIGCAPAPSAPPPPPQVTVAEVSGKEITEWDEFTGRFEAVEAVEIRPRVSGYIRSVSFTEGKEVRPGEVLFEIDPRPYQAALAGAEAELERARTGAELAARDVERAQRLVNVKAISREEFDGRVSSASQGGSSVRSAEAAVTLARLNLEWTKVRSPIAGRVGSAEVTEGNLIQAGPPAAARLTTVVSLDPIYVTFDSDEQTYLKYGAMARAGVRQSSREGKSKVFLGLANEEGRFPHAGYVDFVDNQLDARSGTIRTRAVFSNKDRLFTPGLFARLKLVGSGRYRATLVLDRAIGTDQDKKFVLVMTADSAVEYRPVQLGRLVDGLRIVTAGLTPGERIVVNGLQRVRPGMKVTPTLASMTPDSVTTVARR